MLNVRRALFPFLKSREKNISLNVLPSFVVYFQAPNIIKGVCVCVLNGCYHVSGRSVCARVCVCVRESACLSVCSK